ncbi:MAG: tryptophan-rich sensory protein [Clostridia bacterium]|nr:tryptophan-rich sensory protein [Clostridia bacterium]
MKKDSWKVYLLFVLLSEAVGVLSSLVSRQGMMNSEMIERSVLTPPAVVFPIVWTLLYALMGIAAARVYLSDNSEFRTAGLWLFFLQLAVNFIWSPIYFNLQAFGLSLFVIILLWLLILATTIAFWKTDRISAYLMIPYLLWVTFATYLTGVTWYLNS